MDAVKKDALGHLRKIDEYEFERFVADLWEKFGWQTEVTAGSQDWGIDIIAKRRYPVPQKHVIQAKRWSEDNKVGGPDIREYSSLRHQEESADAVIVVTTSSFTQQAEEAAENLRVKLVDGVELSAIISESEADELVRGYADESSLAGLDCDQCDDVFPTKTALEEHIEEHHVECRYCSEVFPGEDEIREHLNKEHDRSELSRIDWRRVDQLNRSAENE